MGHLVSRERQADGMGCASSSPSSSPGGAPQRASEEVLVGTPLAVTARTLAGNPVTVEALTSHTVANLKTLLEEAGAVPADQQQLLLGTAVLADWQRLQDVGVTEDCELTLLVGAPAPEWARRMGLDGEHPAHLRAYHATHGLQPPEWLDSDEAVWGALASEIDKFEASRKSLEGWKHRVDLEKDGQPAAILRARPGGTVTCAVRGWIHNNRGDTCIHQLILVQDTGIVGELYDGVPMRGKPVHKKLSWKAPAEAGTYMLWRYGDLQYSMGDAKRNLTNRHRCVKGGKYPESFVGWLIVQ